jgi:Glyoxalase/Bleomycin resistance protein/Dioxygenase superfamily
VSGVDDADDIGRITASLSRLGLALDAGGRVSRPGTRVRVRVSVAERIGQKAEPAPVCNGPGRATQVDARGPAVLREAQVRPRKLGHVVLGSTNQEAGQRFFTEGIGFKVSDNVPGIAAFLRCSTDHHNVLVQLAPVPYLHHTSWEEEDVDEIDRGAHRMLEGHPERHVGAWDGTTSARTSSGTSRTRQATSRSTTATWTAWSTMLSGSLGSSMTCASSTAGATGAALVHRTGRPSRADGGGARIVNHHTDRDRPLVLSPEDLPLAEAAPLAERDLPASTRELLRHKRSGAYNTTSGNTATFRGTTAIARGHRCAPECARSSGPRWSCRAGSAARPPVPV